MEQNTHMELQTIKGSTSLRLINVDMDLLQTIASVHPEALQLTKKDDVVFMLSVNGGKNMAKDFGVEIDPESVTENCVILDTNTTTYTQTLLLAKSLSVKLKAIQAQVAATKEELDAIQITEL